MNQPNAPDDDRTIVYEVEDIELRRGQPLPLGATLKRGGINFSIFSKNATKVKLLLFPPGEDRPVAAFQLDPRLNRTGNIWHAYVVGVRGGVEYGYVMDHVGDEQQPIHRFDPGRVLVDPYARVITGGEHWGNLPEAEEGAGESRIKRRRGFVIEDDFDWGDDQPLNTAMSETVIYELHVRGYTRDGSSQAANPGTYAGLIECIPYLTDLGITAVELLPVAEFEEADTCRQDPATGQRLLNFWGYHPIGFFAPKCSYAASHFYGGQVREFKTMVRALHRAGLEVILDVVMNHTAEGDDRGPTVSFRGIDNSVYYIIDPHTGAYANFSGCGNTLNCNHPVVRDLVLDCLRYWVTEMHVDGFRFDLASILGRGRDGEVLTNPPLLERIAADPILASTKIIAEAWDAAGLYQVGSFPAWGRWAEWNGKFRDEVRRFVKSDPGLARGIANRLTGSPDVYQPSGRAPVHSINFITCHDGFTLADLVSYNDKRNQPNGEDSRDGANDNQSWNCGWEGPVDPAAASDALRPKLMEIETLRRRQVRNFAALLLLSRGVPMILAGDEFGRTQFGNNNAYCQDNPVSWVNWGLARKNADLLRFFRLLIKHRRAHLAFRYANFDQPGALVGCPITFHGLKPGDPDWSWESRTFAAQITEHVSGPFPGLTDFYLAINAFWEPRDFELPALSHGRQYHRVLDTALEPPHDIAEPGAEPLLPNQKVYTAGPRSIAVLIGRSL